MWQNFFAGSFISTLKANLLNLMVFVLALTFVTPVYFMQFLKSSGVSDTMHELT